MWCTGLNDCAGAVEHLASKPRADRRFRTGARRRARHCACHAYARDGAAGADLARRPFTSPAHKPVALCRHMLRNGCGFALANAGHDKRALQAYLRHRKIHQTVRYTELAPDRFKDFWR
jgi:Phage integrase family